MMSPFQVSPVVTPRPVRIIENNFLESQARSLEDLWQSILMNMPETTQSRNASGPSEEVHTGAQSLLRRSGVEREKQLRDALKRCSEKTADAACEFWKTGQSVYLPTIVQGVIERFAGKEVHAKFATPHKDLRLVEDLALDSLTMMEIVMLAEEVLPISINNEDLTRLRTLADLENFVGEKLQDFSVRFPQFAEAQN